MISICKEFSFDAAHRLAWHQGKCQNLHGHTYLFRVCVSAEKLNENGIVMDFGDLKQIVKDEILDVYDHKFLNDFFGDNNNSAEAMIQVFADKISSRLPAGIFIKKLELYETPTSCAIWQPN